MLQELQAVKSLGVLDAEVGGIVEGETGDRGSVELGGHIGHKTAECFLSS